MATGVAGETGPGWGEGKRCAGVAIEIRVGSITIATVTFLMAFTLVFEQLTATGLNESGGKD
jgi:hypothetical protein